MLGSMVILALWPHPPRNYSGMPCEYTFIHRAQYFLWNEKINSLKWILGNWSNHISFFRKIIHIKNRQILHEKNPNISTPQQNNITGHSYGASKHLEMLKNWVQWISNCLSIQTITPGLLWHVWGRLFVAVMYNLGNLAILFDCLQFYFWWSRSRPSRWRCWLKNP